MLQITYNLYSTLSTKKYIWLEILHKTQFSFSTTLGLRAFAVYLCLYAIWWAPFLAPSLRQCVLCVFPCMSVKVIVDVFVFVYRMLHTLPTPTHINACLRMCTRTNIHSRVIHRCLYVENAGSRRRQASNWAVFLLWQCELPWIHIWTHTQAQIYIHGIYEKC